MREGVPFYNFLKEIKRVGIWHVSLTCSNRPTQSTQPTYRPKKKQEPEMPNHSSRKRERGQLLPLPSWAWTPMDLFALYLQMEFGDTAHWEVDYCGKLLEAQRAGVPPSKAITRLAQAIFTRS